MKENNCICKEEMMIDEVCSHLAWCPQSYFYKEAVEEYENASWIKKIFLRDPRKYKNFLWTPPY